MHVIGDKSSEENGSTSLAVKKVRSMPLCSITQAKPSSLKQMLVGQRHYFD